MNRLSIAFYGSLLLTFVIAASAWGLWSHWEAMVLAGIGAVLICTILYGASFLMPVKGGKRSISGPTGPDKPEGCAPAGEKAEPDADASEPGSSPRSDAEKTAKLLPFPPRGLKASADSLSPLKEIMRADPDRLMLGEIRDAHGDPLVVPSGRIIISVESRGNS